MASQAHDTAADHARSRDPTLSQEEASMVATVFGARVCGSDGEVCEGLGEFLLRTEKNEMFLDTMLKQLIARVEKLEAERTLLHRRRERLRLPGSRIGR